MIGGHSHDKSLAHVLRKTFLAKWIVVPLGNICVSEFWSNWDPFVTKLSELGTYWDSCDKATGTLLRQSSQDLVREPYREPKNPS